MTIRFRLLLVITLILLPKATVLAQVIGSNPNISELQTDVAETKWPTGLWQVTSIKHVENGQSSEIKHNREILLLFLDNLVIEIGMPDSANHLPMFVVGSENTFWVRDKNEKLYVKSLSYSAHATNRFTISPTNTDRTTAEVDYLRKRANGEGYIHQLNLAKINDAMRLRGLAIKMKPFLDGTADEKMLANFGKNDGQEYHDAIQRWANQTIEIAGR